jgi:high-affinity iron transporter
MLGFFVMRYHEVKGHWPLMKAKKQEPQESAVRPSESSGNDAVENKATVTETTTHA